MVDGYSHKQSTIELIGSLLDLVYTITWQLSCRRLKPPSFCLAQSPPMTTMPAARHIHALKTHAATWGTTVSTMLANSPRQVDKDSGPSNLAPTDIADIIARLHSE